MKNIKVEDGFIEDNIFYFTEFDSKSIYCINLDNGKLTHSLIIPGGLDSIYGRGLKLKIWNNNLIVSPGSDKKIWMYNRVTESWEGFEIEFKAEFYKPSMHIFCTEIVGNTLYLFGCCYPGIILFDLVSRQYKEMTYTWELGENEAHYIVRYGLRRKDDCFYGLSVVGKKLLIFNIKEEKDEWTAYNENGSKNDEFVNKIISEFDYIYMQEEEYLFWHEYKEGIIFQDKDYYLHYISRHNDEKTYKLEMGLHDWEKFQGKSLVDADQYVVYSDNLLFEKDLSLYRYLMAISKT